MFDYHKYKTYFADFRRFFAIILQIFGGYFANICRFSEVFTC